MSQNNNIAPPYNPYTLYTDGCTTLECLQTLAAPSSLQQGQTFDRLTARLHGGRRRRVNRKNGRSRKVRGGGDEPALYPSQFSSMLPMSYQMQAAAQLGPVVDPPTNKFAHNYSGGARRKLKAHGKMRKGTKKHRGGGSYDPAMYPSQFNETLPQELVPLSRTTILDTSIADLAQFNGKYGLLQSGGKRGKRSKTNRRRRHRGGMAPVDSSGMILPPDMEPAAYLNPQWYTENLVVPSYKAPDNSYALASYAQQAYENQIAYRNHNPAAIPVPPPPGIGGGRRRRSRRNKNRKSHKSKSNRNSKRNCRR